MTGSSVAQRIIVGVDTHKDVHVAAAINVHGRLLGHRSVATSEKGCSALHQWALSFAPRVQYGVEGTGSYGAGLARFLQAQGSSMVEIRGPNRAASASPSALTTGGRSSNVLDPALRDSVPSRIRRGAQPAPARRSSLCGGREWTVAGCA
jgi:hypothetical protein